MIMSISELPTLNLNEEELTKALFDGIWIGIGMWFDSPKKIFMWVILLAMFIVLLIIKKKTREKRIRRMAKIQAEEMAAVELKMRKIANEELSYREKTGIKK